MESAARPEYVLPASGVEAGNHIGLPSGRRRGTSETYLRPLYDVAVGGCPCEEGPPLLQEGARHESRSSRIHWRPRTLTHTLVVIDEAQPDSKHT